MIWWRMAQIKLGTLLMQAALKLITNNSTATIKVKSKLVTRRIYGPEYTED